jgi:hypothetical protein
VTTATPEPGVDPAQLTIEYTQNEDGWVTAQVVEYPAAISQGPTQHEAWLNVLNALHDLTHEPTFAERAAFTVDARIAELSDLAAEFGERADKILRGIAEHGRAAADRDRTGVH